MAIQKIEIRPKGTGDYADVLYPKTSADQVVTSDASTVQAKLDAMTDSPRAATLVVAASNSSAAGKAAADYVCTGTGDQTVINNAITALGTNGGKVVLLEGLYSVAAAISLPDNVSLEGQGNGTVLKIANANNITVNVIQNSDTTNGNTGIPISNLKIDGNRANQTAGTQYGINFSKVSYSTIQNVTTVNLRQYGIYISNSSYNRITANTIRNNGFHGIYMDSGTNNTIMGNIIQGNGSNGIYAYASSNNTIVMNTVSENSQTTNVINDNILVDNLSNTNNIQGNTCRQGALTNKPRYGIRINNANCTGNLVTNNDLTTGGATGAFSDVGTGTITTAGNKLA